MEVYQRVSMISSFLMLSLAFGGGGRGQASEASALQHLTGWEKTPYSVHFTADDLHKYLNGGAAKYLAYSIKHLYVQEYQRVSDGYLAVVELYLLDSSHNAFGVYSCDSGGSHPEGLGEEASYEGGLLQFRQGRSYVRVYPRDPSAGGFEAILELGTALSDALGSRSVEAPDRGAGAPGSEGAGGKGARADTTDLPEIVALMPAQGLIKDSLCFFHSQVSLNSIYYLSDKNLLLLSEQTDAVSAEYETSSGKRARVIAVCYPAEETAKKAYRAFCELYIDPGKATGQSPAVEQWAPTGENKWLYAGLRGRVLTLVLEASVESDAVELGQTVLESTAKCGHGGRKPLQDKK
jgi:hypothetical protein